MGQYFDSTFFRYFFSFLGILFVSFLILFVVNVWSEKEQESSRSNEASLQGEIEVVFE